jgi:hypothetical protein
MAQNNPSECLDKNNLLIFYLIRLLNFLKINLIFLVHLKHSNCLIHYADRNACFKYKKYLKIKDER